MAHDVALTLVNVEKKKKKKKTGDDWILSSCQTFRFFHKKYAQLITTWTKKIYSRTSP